MMTTAGTPVRQSAADLRSFIIAGLAVIALLMGGLALHTGSGAHPGHGPTVSGAAATAGTAIAAQHHTTAATGMTAAGTAKPAAPTSGSIAALGVGIAAAGTALAEVDHGLGSDLLAACGLLLALAGSVALILLGRGRLNQGSTTALGDNRRGSIRQRALRPRHLAVHRPDLTVLSISRR